MYDPMNLYKERVIEDPVGHCNLLQACNQKGESEECHESSMVVLMRSVAAMSEGVSC